MTNPSPASDPESKSKLPLICAAIALVVWMGVLINLTGAPRLRVVNQVQVRRADRMITGLVTDRKKKLVEVKRLWFGKKPESNSITVPNLDDVEGVEVEEGQQYLIPMWSDGRIVKVRKRAKLEDNRPAVYPDNEEMRSQVENAIARGLIRE